MNYFYLSSKVERFIVHKIGIVLDYDDETDDRAVGVCSGFKITNKDWFLKIIYPPALGKKQ